MAMPDDNNGNRSSGVLNGQGVGIAIIAIFVGVALAVAYFASHGALFAQSSAPSPADTGHQHGVTVPAPETSSVATVISRDVFDKEPSNTIANSTLQPQEGNTSAMSDAKQELMAIKDFPWSSVSGKYVNDSQERFNNLKQHSEQKQPPPPSEPLVFSDRILVNTNHKDESSTTTPAPFENVTSHEIPSIESNTASQIQQNDTGNGTTTSNSTDSSSSNSTQNFSPNEENSDATGVRVEVSLG